jgi:hypothetical protein
MGATGENIEKEKLLTQAFIDRLGFDSLSTVFPGNVPPLYLYAATFVFLDFGIVNTYFHIFTQRAHGFIQNPFSLAIPASVIIAAVGIQYMAFNYQQALKQMSLAERIEDAEQPTYTGFTVSLRTRTAVYLSILAIYYVYIFLIIGLPAYLETFGVISTFAFAGVIYPLGYIPIAVEFTVLFASIHFVLPRQIAKTRPSLAFLDPRNLGGFYPIGKLLKRTYYIYTAGLLFFLCYIYGPTMTGLGTAGISRVGTPEAAFFTLLWVFGLTAVGTSMFTIHRLMVREKESHLSQLEQQLYDIVDNPYDISSTELHDNPEIEQIQQRIEQVQAMREYPTTTSTSTQLLVSILLPEILNLLLQFIL